MRAWIGWRRSFALFFAENWDRYGPIWDVIDRRWHNLLHRPIHAAAYFLNPAYQFSPHFKVDNEVWSGLYDVVERMSPNSRVGTIVVREIELFKKAQGDLFAQELCKKNRTESMPGKNLWFYILISNSITILIWKSQSYWYDLKFSCFRCMVGDVWHKGAKFIEDCDSHLESTI